MNRFKIGDHIGSGGFGTVDEALRLDDQGRVVEEGLVRKRLLDQWADDSEALSRFRREVRMLDQMSHPHVIEVRGRNLSDSPPWFVMPRAESTLKRELASGKAGDVPWVIKTFSAILSAMAYAHSERRIVHRDLKPENVLIVGGVPKVSDFGLGKRLDPNTVDLTSTNIGMGTTRYMAPEQFEDAAHVGPPADVYSLGKMLGEMLTGRTPMVGRPRLEDFPEEFRSFIDRCTQDDPSDRYANASDAEAAFQLLVSGGGQTGYVSGGQLEGHIRRWEITPEGQDHAVVKAIAQELVARREDEELYFHAVPRLPTLLVEQIIKNRPGDFDVILRAYDRHIQGGLPFEYCDVVANFYRQVFHASPDLRHRRLILQRLVEMGASHNRWYVGDVVGGLLAQLEAPEAVTMAADVIRQNPYHARWFRPYVANRTLPGPIRSAFNALEPEYGATDAFA